MSSRASTNPSEGVCSAGNEDFPIQSQSLLLGRKDNFFGLNTTNPMTFSGSNTHEIVGVGMPLGRGRLKNAEQLSEDSLSP